MERFVIKGANTATVRPPHSMCSSICCSLLRQIENAKCLQLRTREL